MILTGRVGLIALICVLPIAVSPWPAIAFAVLLAALVAVVIVDVALAASTRRLNCSRLGETAARLGQPVDAALVVENASGRPFRGQIRDAWAPSARAQPRTHPVNLAAGQQVRLVTQLRPVRRGDQRSALVTARSVGPLGLAGRQSSHRVPWQIRILPPFLSRKHLPSRLAKLRELEGMTPVLIRGQGTEFDSLREYVIGDDVRSIDWRATARRGDVLVRTCARMTVDLMFNAIADHISDLTPVAAPERLRSSMINGIKHWQVDYTGLNTRAATGSHDRIARLRATKLFHDREQVGVVARRRALCLYPGSCGRTSRRHSCSPVVSANAWF